MIHYTATINPEANISGDIKKPALALSIFNEGIDYLDYLGRGGDYGCPVLFRGEYGCLVNKKGSLNEKAEVTMDDLKEYYFIAPNLRELGVSPALAPSILNDFVNAIPSHRVVEVDAVANVIELLQKYPKGYVLTCYPACKRYAAVESGELRYIPLRGFDTRVNICLFYSKQVYNQYPAIRELVHDVQAASIQFLSDYGNG